MRVRFPLNDTLFILLTALLIAFDILLFLLGLYFCLVALIIVFDCHD